MTGVRTLIADPSGELLTVSTRIPQTGSITCAIIYLFCTRAPSVIFSLGCRITARALFKAAEQFCALIIHPAYCDGHQPGPAIFHRKDRPFVPCHERAH